MSTVGEDAWPHDAALPARRRSNLVQFVHERGQATITELSEALQVSADTVRRDLAYLAGQGVARTYGGAVATDRFAAADLSFESRSLADRAGKDRIGLASAALVADGQTIILNGGTTTLAVARALGSRRALTLVTNNLRLPMEVPPECFREVYMLGGSCRVKSNVTIGPVGFAGVHSISADVCFIGVAGVSHDGGLSTSNLAEAQMMREMMNASRRVVVLATTSKFGRNAFVHISSFDMVSTLITDGTPPEEVRTALTAAQVELIVA